MAQPLIASRWAAARWLVVAPHADDETLGTGALIAHAAKHGRLGGVVYLTDGTGSHPDGTPRLAIVRKAEARGALRRLGAGDVRVDWLGWRDAHPHEAGSAAFRRSAATLAGWLRDRKIDAIAVSDRLDRHCDHQAAYRLAQAAASIARRGVSVFGYHVWSVPAAGARRLRTPPMPPGKRRAALHAHRSQTTPLLGDGFRLAARQVRMQADDILTLRRIAS